MLFLMEGRLLGMSHICPVFKYGWIRALADPHEFEYLAISINGRYISL